MDFFTLLINFTTNAVEPLIRFAAAISYLAGVWIFVGGLFELKKMGDYRSMMYQPTDFKGPIVAILFGAALIWLPLVLNVGTQTIFNSMVVEERAPNTFNDVTIEFIVATLFRIMKLVGIIAFIRGWLMLAKLGNQQSAGQGLMGRSFVHILFGILSFHMAATMLVVCRTLDLECRIIVNVVA